MGAAMNLWDDNPTVTDLLGIDVVVDATVAAIRSPELDPVTISIQSPWGGGKSSALAMIAARLDSEPNVVVLRADPWEYEDVDDIRATVISQVLAGIGADKPAIRDRIASLVKRISWTRVANTVARSALTVSMDPEKLLEAFTPTPEQPKSMSGFRSEFADVMGDSGLDRVVVLVDDLDRCKPSTVVSTLEAIKVFLSVPKMSFVLAAEEEMIRWAIGQDAHGGGRADYSDRYLEKIVQLPVSLPRLTRDSAETFVALLLAQKSAPSVTGFEGLLRHASERRAERKWPYVGGVHGDGVHAPTATDLSMAVLISRGLDADQWNSPRAIKRFLNAWTLRSSVAATRGLTIDAAVSLKMFILEERFRSEFTALASLGADERSVTIAAWEDWANDVAEAVRPEFVSDGTREWAKAQPSLRDSAAHIDSYLHLASSFSTLLAASGLSDEDLQILDMLGSESTVNRNEAVAKVTDRDVNQRLSILDRLFVRLSSYADPNIAIESACDIAVSDAALTERFAAGVRAYGLQRLDMSAAMEIAQKFPDRDGIAGEIAGDAGVSDIIRKAVDDQLNGGGF